MSNIPVNTDIPVKVMKAIFQVVLGDMTQKKFKECLLCYGIKTPAPEYYSNTLSIIFRNFKPLLEGILKKNREKVVKYYERCGSQLVRRKMNICASGDGCYTRRSFSSIYASRYCIVFMIESWTGTVVDVTLIEKCCNKKCKKRLYSLLECSEGKFHGGSKSLEVSAVLELYKQSDTPDFPLRYTTYVGDGDANVHNSIKSHTPAFYNGEFEI